METRSTMSAKRRERNWVCTHGDVALGKHFLLGWTPLPRTPPTDATDCSRFVGGWRTRTPPVKRHKSSKRSRRKVTTRHAPTTRCAGRLHAHLLVAGGSAVPSSATALALYSSAMPAESGPLRDDPPEEDGSGTVPRILGITRTRGSSQSHRAGLFRAHLIVLTKRCQTSVKPLRSEQVVA